MGTSSSCSFWTRAKALLSFLRRPFGHSVAASAKPCLLLLENKKRKRAGIRWAIGLVAVARLRREEAADGLIRRTILDVVFHLNCQPHVQRLCGWLCVTVCWSPLTWQIFTSLDFYLINFIFPRHSAHNCVSDRGRSRDEPDKPDWLKQRSTTETGALQSRQRRGPVGHLCDWVEFWNNP